MSSDYKDMMSLNRPDSRYPRMDNLNRAVQFAPFAALTGFDELLGETLRKTEERRDLAEEQKDELDWKLQELMERIDEHPIVRVTYFVPDISKPGGKYKDYESELVRIDLRKGLLVFVDGKKIKLPDIVDLD